MSSKVSRETTPSTDREDEFPIVNLPKQGPELKGAERERTIQRSYPITKIIPAIIIGISATFLIVSLIKDIVREKNSIFNENMQRIEKCRKDYEENKCSSKNLGPFLASECRKLFDCMSSSPKGISETKMTAKFLAQMIDEFVSHLSFKSVLMIAVAGFAAIWLAKLF